MTKTENREKQLSFEFCGSCGGYIQPDEAAAIVQNGEAVVLCRDCKGIQTDSHQTPDAMATYFIKKYNL